MDNILNQNKTNVQSVEEKCAAVLELVSEWTPLELQMLSARLDQLAYTKRRERERSMTVTELRREWKDLGYDE